MNSTLPPKRTSPTRNSINVIGAKLTRVWSRDGTGAQGTESDSEVASLKSGVDEYIPPTMTDNTSRSRSRGRELFSTGRGGAGNIHSSPSRNADGSQTRGGYDYEASPAPRGREPAPSGEHITHVGRGGAGNIREASRPRESISTAQASYEHDLIERHDENPHAFSTGRGGAGNIRPSSVPRSPSQPRSASRGPSHLSTSNDSNAPSQAQDRSLSRGRVMHSTGRGGVGNITSDTLREEGADELERRAVSPSRHHLGEVHSTGRGGLANVTALGTPNVEASPARGEAGVMSTGRGGAGNIASRDRTRSASRGPGARSGSRGHGAGGTEGEYHGQSMMEKIMEKVVGRKEEKGSERD